MVGGVTPGKGGQQDANGLPIFDTVADAAHLSAGGIPSICIGPGSIHQAHTVDEYIDIEALKAGADFFTKFVRGLKADVRL